MFPNDPKLIENLDNRDYLCHTGYCSFTILLWFSLSFPDVCTDMYICGPSFFSGHKFNFKAFLQIIRKFCLFGRFSQFKEKFHTDKSKEILPLVLMAIKLKQQPLPSTLSPLAFHPCSRLIRTSTMALVTKYILI